MDTTRKIVVGLAIGCLVACVGEFATIIVLGSQYPGYSQLKDTMSALGASASPVSGEISAWWVIMGLLMIGFGIGLRLSFHAKPGSAIAAWMVILYGMGEGLGSGLFKADHLNGALTQMAIVHDILGGIGVVAILAFPLIMAKVLDYTEMPHFHRFSNISCATGILFIALFLFRYTNNPNNFFTAYKGLWQRLFMLNTYVYLSCVAILVVLNERKKQPSPPTF